MRHKRFRFTPTRLEALHEVATLAECHADDVADADPGSYGDFDANDIRFVAEWLRAEARKRTPTGGEGE